MCRICRKCRKWISHYKRLSANVWCTYCSRLGTHATGYLAIIHHDDYSPFFKLFSTSIHVYYKPVPFGLFAGFCDETLCDSKHSEHGPAVYCCRKYFVINFLFLSLNIWYNKKDNLSALAYCEFSFGSLNNTSYIVLISNIIDNFFIFVFIPF